MTAIGATPPTATRAEPADIVIGNFVENAPFTTDVTVTGLRRSNASYEIESINNDVNLKTNNIIGAKLAQNGDFSVHTSDLFTKKSNGFTGFGTNNPTSKVHIKEDDASLVIGSDDFELINMGNRGSGVGLDKAFLRMKAAGVSTVVLDTAGNSYFNGGNFGLGTPDPVGRLNLATTSTTVLNIDSYNASAPSSRMVLRSSRNASIGGETATQSGDSVGSISFQGVNSSPIFDSAAEIVVTQNGAATASTVPADMVLATWGDSARNTNQLILHHDGGIFMSTLKSGATQGGAGAAANELWITASHATQEDNTIMIGV